MTDTNFDLFLTNIKLETLHFAKPKVLVLVDIATCLKYITNIYIYIYLHRYI